MTMEAINRDSAFAPSTPAMFYDRLWCGEGTGKQPLVLVHGAGHTGACYLQTPDGRPGWAQYFARSGYDVYVPDWPGMGRSGRMDPTALTGEIVAAALGALLEALDQPAILLTHSMSGAYGWKVLETHANCLKAVIGVAASGPGNIEPVPQVLERGDDYVVVRRGAFDRRVDFTRARRFDDKIVDDKLIGVGSTQFPRAALEAYRQSLTETPPRLAYERSNVEGSQIRLADFAAMRDIPVLMVTAEADPDHTKESDQAIVDWFVEQGLSAALCYLPDHNIAGNGHMVMLEKNSDAIAGLIGDWIERVVAS
jgi:pimeloyl-ACP methyl ester carboxylesterase